jgi:effector-binding domain-containing protein
MRPKLLVAMAVASALLSGCHQNPRPRPPHLSRRPTTQGVDWPATFPSTTPAVRQDYHVSPMRTGSLAPRPLLYVRETVTFHTLERSIEKAVADFQAAAADGRVRFEGPPVVRYMPATAELSKAFVVEVGFPVARQTAPFGRFRMRRETERFTCAVVKYTGPLKLIDKAYDELIPAIDAAGLEMVDEAREVYLRWDGFSSPENEVLVAIGVKSEKRQ